MNQSTQKILMTTETHWQHVNFRLSGTADRPFVAQSGGLIRCYYDAVSDDGETLKLFWRGQELVSMSGHERETMDGSEGFVLFTPWIKL